MSFNRNEWVGLPVVEQGTRRVVGEVTDAKLGDNGTTVVTLMFKEGDEVLRSLQVDTLKVKKPSNVSVLKYNEDKT